MRILHVGTGFRPLRRGGLVAYVEDVIDEQVRRGHDVAYLFAGRYRPIGATRLHRWRRGPVEMLEILNSPIHDHGRQPDLEVSEPRIERLAREAIAGFRPDVVHVQELAGLPFSLLDVARESGAVVILTLQDYFAVCPAFKLLDHEGELCLRHDDGEACVATTSAEARDPAALLHASLRHDLWRIRGIRRLPPDRRRPVVDALSEAVTALARPRFRAGRGDAAAFQHRRELNVERLNRVDRIVAMSGRVAELHAQLGVDPARLRTMRLTLASIERLRPRMRRPGSPVTFATLGGSESPAKGSRLLLEAARALTGTPGFRLLVLGHPEPAFLAAARDVPEIEIHGPYAPEQLDALLDDVDVGIVPSVWEEAYGYAGVEFLAKGIPVIGNARGGIVEYVHDGETGWLNRSAGAAELAAIMRGIAERPEQVDALNARLRERHDELVLTMAQHGDELDALYREELARRSG